MAAQIIIALCATVVAAQAYAIGGCGCGGVAGAGLGYGGLGGNGGWGGWGGWGGVASTGGGLPVSSASSVQPVGISVLSQNAYEGTLNVGGNLPFLGTVALEGVLPTAGAAAVSYGCGNGGVGIGAEGPIGTGILGGGSYAPALGAGLGGIGYGAGIGGIGYGAGIGGIGYGAGIGGCGCGVY